MPKCSAQSHGLCRHGRTFKECAQTSAQSARRASGPRTSSSACLARTPSMVTVIRSTAWGGSASGWRRIHRAHAVAVPCAHRSIGPGDSPATSCTFRVGPYSIEQELVLSDDIAPLLLSDVPVPDADIAPLLLSPFVLFLFVVAAPFAAPYRSFLFPGALVTEGNAVDLYLVKSIWVS